MGYFEDKQERNWALLRALGLTEGSEPTEPESPPDFDGGVREPFLASDPEKDHNAFLVKLFENTKLGGGGEW